MIARERWKPWPAPWLGLLLGAVMRRSDRRSGHDDYAEWIDYGENGAG